MSHPARPMRPLFCLMLAALGACSIILPDRLQAQVNNIGGNNNQGNNGLGNQGNNQGNRNGAGGVAIDADGILNVSMATDASGTLDRKRREALAKKSANSDLNESTKARCVSLTELERTIDQLLADQKPLPDDVFYLAGLQQIDEVLVLPEAKDIVLCGPAEGFVPDQTGRMIGVASGRPTLRLDDMVVALRTLLRSREVGCSIDPVPERLADLQRFIKQGGPATVDVVESRFRQMDDILGLQNVRIDGVPPESHFSVALVEADYRMKRISVGLENPGVKGLKSHLSMVGAGGNAIQRWWFVPLYDGIYRSEDSLAFKFAGPRAQLLAEEELADAQGNRSPAATTRLSTKAFAKQFTDKFPELAAKSPIFGELQNLIDWVVFAALMQRERIPGRVEWKMATLLDEKKLTIPTFIPPKKVASVVNFKRAGSQVVGLVGGGVIIEPDHVLRKAISNLNGQQLETDREQAAGATRNESHRWWWDVPASKSTRK